MRHYHKNPRRITEKQFLKLQAWLQELGDLGGIVHDLNSDEIIGGNQRVEALGVVNIKPTIVETYESPNAQGTVAVGFFMVKGEQFKYRAVRWNADQCEKANIIANAAGGGWDYDVLANQFNVEDLLNWGFEENQLFGGENFENTGSLEKLEPEPSEGGPGNVITVKVGNEDRLSDAFDAINEISSDHPEWKLRVTC